MLQRFSFPLSCLLELISQKHTAQNGGLIACLLLRISDVRRLHFEIQSKHLLDLKLPCIVSIFISYYLYLNTFCCLQRYTKNCKVFTSRLEMVMKTKCFVFNLSSLNSKLCHKRSKSISIIFFQNFVQQSSSLVVVDTPRRQVNGKRQWNFDQEAFILNSSLGFTLYCFEIELLYIAKKNLFSIFLFRKLKGQKQHFIYQVGY